MRALMTRLAPAAALLAAVSVVSTGCGSAQHPATANVAAAGSVTSEETGTAPPSTSDASGSAAATSPGRSAGVTVSSASNPVAPPLSTRSSVPHSPPSTVPVPYPVDPPRTQAPAQPRTVTATTAENGGTVHVPLGGSLSLVGFPSNWQPQTSDPAVLKNPPLPVDPGMCKTPPGVPCQLPPMDFRAVARGTVQVTAHRTQCGEARPCVPPESYDYVLTVVVD